MAAINQNRLAALESQVGQTLPPTLLAKLSGQKPIQEGRVAFITVDRVWDVRTSYTLDEGAREHQLDRVYALVGEVLPPGTIPTASDWGGNFYCLVLAGSHAGKIVYWDHERDLGDHRVEAVADFLDQFFANLVSDPDNAEA